CSVYRTIFIDINGHIKKCEISVEIKTRCPRLRCRDLGPIGYTALTVKNGNSDSSGMEVDGQAEAVRQDGFVSSGDELEHEEPHDISDAVELVVVDVDALDVDFNHGRIAKIENLESLTQVENLCLRQNLITKIDGLSTLTTLVELDLYDNQLTKIENLEALVNLQSLDLSFNRLSKIENLDTLTNLKKLFLIHNKITKIENVDHLVNLEMLELGSNRIRVIENISSLTNLTSLFIGNNKITKLQCLDTFVNLRTLSMQSNRITKLGGLEKLVNLDDLYLSDNGIEKLEGLEACTKLTTLDLAKNRLTKIENISHLFNDNKIDSWKEVESLVPLKNLETVYMERNPIYYEAGKQLKADPAYRRKIKLTLPWIKQIDATLAQ
ncbi:PP1R7-like protein, partial [Mya arenaria]